MMILLLYASSTTSADPFRNSRDYHFPGHENTSYRNALRSIHRRSSRSNSVLSIEPHDRFSTDDRSYSFGRHLIAREAKSKKHSAAPAAQPKPSPQQAKKVEQKQQASQKKAQEKAVKNEKKAQANAAKMEKKAEVQKIKDQKLVSGIITICSILLSMALIRRTENLKLEAKGQNKAAAAAKKNVQKVESNYNKGIEKENKRLAKDERNANNHLAKAQREFSKQKGGKSEGKALQNLAKDQSKVSRVSQEHNKRLQQLGQKTTNELGKNSRNLEKGLTKAHNDNFDSNGKAKQHLNSKFQTTPDPHNLSNT